MTVQVSKEVKVIKASWNQQDGTIDTNIKQLINFCISFQQLAVQLAPSKSFLLLHEISAIKTKVTTAHQNSLTEETMAS